MIFKAGDRNHLEVGCPPSISLLLSSFPGQITALRSIRDRCCSFLLCGYLVSQTENGYNKRASGFVESFTKHEFSLQISNTKR